MSERDYWKHISGVLVLLQTIALLVSVYFLREQARDLSDTKANRSIDLVFRFDERLSKPPLVKVRTAIENNRPILKANHGKFTDEDLEGYLDLLDSLNDVYMTGLISKDIFYNAYSYDIVKAYDNAEVQSFLKESRIEVPDSYSGFERLAKEIKAAAPPAGSPAAR
jgi:hypothetical protein